MASRRLGGSASALRFALLASLGLLGVACGGSSTSDGAVTSTVGQCSSPRIDPKTQLQVCEEGYSHRPQAVRCQPSADAPAAGTDAAPPGLSYCDGDDCSRLKDGYCAFAGYAPAQCKSGCVEDADCGEASAALEALEAAGTATDPLIVAAYARIAADEQRHAELAFRFVRWALGVGGGAVSERIEAALASELGQSHAARGVAGPCLSALVSSWTAQPKTPSGVPIKLCQAK